MKRITISSYVLLAGFLGFGTACSSTSSNGTSETATSSTVNTRMGTDMNPTPAPDANSGMAPSGAATGPDVAGTSTVNAATDANADASAFMATFATMKDPVFLMNAASSNLLEVQVGQMAAQKASNPEVRRFAQTMVSQHLTSTQELKAIAMPLGVKVPTEMMPVHQAMADKLQHKNGKEFDEAYMDLMEQAHKMDVAMFEAKSKSAETPSVKDFAAKMLPILRTHETEANALEKKVD